MERKGGLKRATRRRTLHWLKSSVFLSASSAARDVACRADVLRMWMGFDGQREGGAEGREEDGGKGCAGGRLKRERHGGARVPAGVPQQARLRGWLKNPLDPRRNRVLVVAKRWPKRGEEQVISGIIRSPSSCGLPPNGLDPFLPEHMPADCPLISIMPNLCSMHWNIRRLVSPTWLLVRVHWSPCESMTRTSAGSSRELARLPRARIARRSQLSGAARPAPVSSPRLSPPS